MSNKIGCEHTDYPPEAGVLCDACIMRKDQERIADLESKLASANREIERLRSFLKEATECVADWGLYASEYFQKKHDLDGDIRRFRDALKHNPTTEKSKP